LKAAAHKRVMKVRFTVMIQKQSNNHRSGRANNHQEQKKGQQVWSSTKSMLIVFFDVKQTVHRESVPRNTMVNSDFYCDVLRRLRENVQQKN
jgi:hypothetical protein